MEQTSIISMVREPDQYNNSKIHTLLPSNFEKLKVLGLTMVWDCPIDQPLPIHFSPEIIVNYPCDCAVSIGIHALTLYSTLASFCTSHDQQSTLICQLQTTAPVLDDRFLDNFQMS